jgi:magnesium-transporting ATPase (P-type)
MSESLECGNCGLKLSLSYPESCPKCGSKKQILSVVGEGGVIIGGKGIIEFYNKYRKINKFLFFLVILLSLIQTFIGLLIGSPFREPLIGYLTGIIINIIISIIVFFLGYHAIINIEQKEKYS